MLRICAQIKGFFFFQISHSICHSEFLVMKLAADDNLLVNFSPSFISFHFFSFLLRLPPFSHYWGIFYWRCFWYIMYYVIGIATWVTHEHSAWQVSANSSFSKVSLISLHTYQLGIFGCATWRWRQLASWYFFPSLFPFSLYSVLHSQLN